MPRKSATHALVAPATSQSDKLLVAAFGANLSGEEEWPTDPYEKARLFNLRTRPRYQLKFTLDVSPNAMFGGDIDNIVDVVKRFLVQIRESHLHIIMALKRFFWAVRAIARAARRRSANNAKLVGVIVSWWTEREEELRDEYHQKIQSSTYRLHHSLAESIADFQRTCTPQDLKVQVVRTLVYRRRIEYLRQRKQWRQAYNAKVHHLEKLKNMYGNVFAASGSDRQAQSREHLDAVAMARQQVTITAMQSPVLEISTKNVSLQQLLNICTEVQRKRSRKNREDLLDQWEREREREKRERRELLVQIALRRDEEIRREAQRKAECQSNDASMSTSRALTPRARRGTTAQAGPAAAAATANAAGQGGNQSAVRSPARSRRDEALERSMSMLESMRYKRSNDDSSQKQRLRRRAPPAGSTADDAASTMAGSVSFARFQGLAGDSSTLANLSMVSMISTVASHSTAPSQVFGSKPRVRFATDAADATSLANSQIIPVRDVTREKRDAEAALARQKEIERFNAERAAEAAAKAREAERILEARKAEVLREVEARKRIQVPALPGFFSAARSRPAVHEPVATVLHIGAHSRARRFEDDIGLDGRLVDRQSAQARRQFKVHHFLRQAKRPLPSAAQTNTLPLPPPPDAMESLPPRRSAATPQPGAVGRADSPQRGESPPRRAMTPAVTTVARLASPPRGGSPSGGGGSPRRSADAEALLHRIKPSFMARAVRERCERAVSAIMNESRTPGIVADVVLSPDDAPRRRVGRSIL